METKGYHITKGEETKLKTIREILKTQTNKPRGTTKKSYLSEGDDGGFLLNLLIFHALTSVMRIKRLSSKLREIFSL